MKHQLTNEQLQMLRETSVINNTEIAYVMGDLLVIENVQNGSKRTQSHAIVERIIGENNKRILKG
tara:strand:+ start:8364 stop:8558 length:195 start_codon:yes stop_codon:yes gene_type:complete